MFAGTELWAFKSNVLTCRTALLDVAAIQVLNFVHTTQDAVPLCTFKLVFLFTWFLSRLKGYETSHCGNEFELAPHKPLFWGGVLFLLIISKALVIRFRMMIRGRSIIYTFHSTRLSFHKVTMQTQEAFQTWRTVICESRRLR